VAYRPTARTEARRAEIRDRIVRAAFELIRRGGYREASVAAVAAGARVATGTVYRHFPSKADLFAEVFRVASQHEVDAVAKAAARESTPPAQIAAAVETFVRRAVRGRRLAWALLAEPVDPAVEAERLVFRQAYARVFSSSLRDGVLNGSLPPQDPDLTAAALVGAIGEVMTREFSDEEAVVASLVRFCHRSITEEPDVHRHAA
jgi:AcrR family transcriptional regulator